MESYSVRVGPDDLVASASHFITLGGDVCERLHGHDYRATVEVSGPLDADGFVVDFVVLRQIVQAILAEWDHRVLLPAAGTTIRVAPAGDHVEVAHGSRRWVFPRGDCAVLPIPATTTEHLAGLLARRVAEDLSARADRVAAPGGLVAALPRRISVELAEAAGQTARCELRLG